MENKRYMNAEGEKLPFFMAYPMKDEEEPDVMEDRDRLVIKDLYPDSAKKIQEAIEEECDRLEYDGSVMFDEYPDKIVLQKIRDNIYAQVQEVDDLLLEKSTAGSEEDVYTMNYIPPRDRRRTKEHWMKDLIEVALYNEMYHRRCRRRGCRRRWY